MDIRRYLNRSGPEALETSNEKRPDEQVCREASDSVYQDLFSDPDYSKALQCLAPETDSSATQCLQEFDMLHGAPVIDYSSEKSDEPAVASTEELNGKTVREHLSDG